VAAGRPKGLAYLRLTSGSARRALEEGEDRGVELYSKDLAECDPKTRKLIDTDLLPEQRRTHDLCRTLKSYMSAPS